MRVACLRCAFLLGNAVALLRCGKRGIVANRRSAECILVESEGVGAVQVLLGYREIPETEEAIVSVLNPSGAEMRMEKRVWNAGDCRIKLLTYQSSASKEAARAKEGVAEENATEKNALER